MVVISITPNTKNNTLMVAMSFNILLTLCLNWLLPRSITMHHFRILKWY